MKKRNISAVQIVTPMVCLLLMAVLAAIVLSQASALNREGLQELWFVMGMSLNAAFLAAGCIYSLESRAGLENYLCAVCLLISIGFAYQFLFEEFLHHMMMVTAGLVAAVVVYALWRRLNSLNNALYLLVLMGILALLAINMLFGITENGAKLWVNLGIFSFQPGEVVKVLLIMLGASSFRNIRRGLAYCVVGAVSCGVLLMLKDLGGAVIIFANLLLMTYLLFDNRLLSLTIMGAAVAGFVCMVTALPHAAARLDIWGEAMVHPDSWQQRSYIQGVLLGGWRGLGVENAHWYTDVFSAASDGALGGVMAVYGLGAAAAAIACYAALTMTAAVNHSVYPSNFFIHAQLGMYLFTQVLLNFAGSLDVLPFTGVVAPLISDGGTSTICFFILLGLGAAALNPQLTSPKEETHYAC